ncbi:MAG: contact-dependent growth inhibition system immunity protein [Desulfomonilaceae bacterium]
MKSAAAYKRGQKIYLDPESRTTAGVWIGTGPVIVLEESESPSRKGNCLREVLRHSQEGVPHPTNWDHFDSPLLDLAGVKSWSKFAKSTLCCSVHLEGDQLELVPSKNLGAKGGYVQIQDRKMAISFDTSDEELGLFLEKAFDASE